MILYWGDTTTIKAVKWYVMELRSERTAEEILKRVLLALKPTFRNEAVEVFIPEQRSRANSFALLTDSYVFVRADDVIKVGKLRKVTGIQGFCSKDDSTRISSFLTVEDDYVQDLQLKVQVARHERGAAIKEGGWVKILDGWNRDLYGHVESVADGRACVRLDLKTKLWFVDTSVYNLLDCSDIPPQFRVFYYGPSVEKMIDDDPIQAAELLKDDLFHDEGAVRRWLFGEEEGVTPVPVTAEDGANTSRERTPSRFVRSLIQTGETDVHVLLTQTVEAIRAGHLRRPQTTTILWHVIRTEVFHHAFPDESFKNYTELVAVKGEAYNLYPAEVRAAFPELVHQEDTAKEDAARGALETQTMELAKTCPTVTAYARASLLQGKTDMMAVVAQLEVALRRGVVRAPKHARSLVMALRKAVFKQFRPKLGEKASYADIVTAEGANLVVNLPMVLAAFPELDALVRQVRARQDATPKAAPSEPETLTPAIPATHLQRSKLA